MSDSTSPKPATDLNLLFGLLALQLDFITKEGLLAAMHAWLLEKQTPLADLLVRTGALSADRRLLLEALVREHLKQHGDDPQQSLASLSSVDAAKQQLGQLADPDLQASLAPLLSSPVLSMSSTQSVITKGSADDTPKNTERFRVLRYHAEGGLGQVWVAEDSELHREVALKVIQPKKAHEASHQTRFVLEAEITGGLEHPGIVPVYGLGQYADGRPFYAMKFIRGDSLKTAITAFHQRFADSAAFDPAAWNLELRKLLQRFLDVCNTVAYAHSRGVLHRDLKPGNVMIGKYGETLVVDWGLAKAVGERVADVTHPDEATLHPATSDSYETASGSAIGTPAYMPPEQAAGRLTELGPHSDVYSLGATLYHLLTNRAPFEGTTKEILDRVIAEGVVPPHERSRRVPLGLSAICVKSMQRQPSARYASPRDLAQDIERWLADEAITARRDGVVTMIRRWVRRHQVLAASLIVAGFILGAVGLVNNWTRNREAVLLRKNAEAEFAEVDDLLSKRNAVEATRQINRVQGQLKDRPDLIDLVERAHNLASRAEKLVLAQQTMQEFQFLTESATKPADLRNSDARAIAIDNLERTLNTFGILDRDDWQSTEPFASLSDEQQAYLPAAGASLEEEYCNVQRLNSHRGAAATRLGVQLHMPSDRLVRVSRVAEVVPGSPAANANLMPDDRIISVAGKAVGQLNSLDDVRNLLIGEPNTKVELQVIRGRPAKLETLSITRSSDGRVGIVQFLYETIQVAFVLANSPAAQAGIRAGDILLRIDGHPPEGPIIREGNIATTSPLSGLFGALMRADSTTRQLTLWRPSDQTVHNVEVPWNASYGDAVRRNHFGILYRFLRSEYGAYQFAIETRSESLLTALGVENADASIDESIVQSKRKEWPEDLLRAVLAKLTQEFEQNPEFPKAIRFVNEQKYAEVVDVLLPYVPQHLTDTDAAGLLIHALRKVQRPGAAISICSQAIAVRPQATRFYQWRADAFVELKELELAKRDLRRARELDPGNQQYRSLLEALESPIEKLKAKEKSN